MNVVSRGAEFRRMGSDLSRYWPRPIPEAKPYAGRGLPSRILDCVSLLRIRNIPTHETVERVIAIRPGSETLMREWAETWRRSFPSAHAGEWVYPRNEDPTLEPDALPGVAASVEAMWLRRGDTKTAAAWRSWSEGMGKVAGMRGWWHHVIDDAATTMALRHARPREAFLLLGDVVLELEGHHDDGLPMLRRTDYVKDSHNHKGREYRFLRTLRKERDKADLPPYWESPAFLRSAGRRFGVCRTLIELATTLASMGAQGHAKAFLKGIGVKATWTVPLRSDGDVLAAMDAAVMAMRVAEIPDAGIIVQEHVPFAFEQRFFVVDGRIVCSVCSDRHHDVLDGTRRRLDRRVARLRVKEIEAGAFDRGTTSTVEDPALAASFAREARRIVRELRAEGYRDFVVDMGSTDRGVLPIELNGILSSGPYGLDRRRLIEARARMRDEVREEFERRVHRVASTMIGPVEVVDDVVGRVLEHTVDLRDMFYAVSQESDDFDHGRPRPSYAPPANMSRGENLLAIEETISRIPGIKFAKGHWSILSGRTSWLPFDAVDAVPPAERVSSLLPDGSVVSYVSVSRIGSDYRPDDDHRGWAFVVAVPGESETLVATGICEVDRGILRIMSSAARWGHHLGSAGTPSFILDAFADKGDLPDDVPFPILDHVCTDHRLEIDVVVRKTTEGRSISVVLDHLRDTGLVRREIDLPMVARSPVVSARLVPRPDGTIGLVRGG